MAPSPTSTWPAGSLERRVEEVLERAIAGGVCSAAAAATGDATGQRTWLRGRTRSHPSPGPALVAGSPFDLASLTKPMATAALAMALTGEGHLDPDRAVADWLPVGSRDMTVLHLLGHASGLPAHRDLYLRLAAGDRGGATGARAGLVALAVATPLERAPGSSAIYSDLGYIVLGALIERVAGRGLDELAGDLLAELGLDRTGFVDLTRADRPGFAAPPVATEIDGRGLVEGEVHDENCHAGGGVAGHAGLFAPLADVARFAAALAVAPRRAVGRLRPDVVRRFLTTAAAPATSWRLGWDTPSAAPGVSHAGDAWPREHAAGHLGFTGTSLWLDWARGRWTVLLTNRVHPSRARPEAAGIKGLRRAVGDLTWALLERGL